MAQDGDYAFVVYVENRFLKQSGQKDDDVPIIKVTHHFYDKNKPDKEKPDGTSVHLIHSRDALCFPLYWKKEYLEITLEKDSWDKLPEQYHIWSGPKSNIKLFKNPGDQIYPSLTTLSGDITYDKKHKKYKRKIDTSSPDKGWFLKGGGWKFKKDSKEPNIVFPTDMKWMLKVYKLVHDPEEENVTVGEVPPV